MTATSPGARRGLRLDPFRALRPATDGPRLGRLLCPPYDVIDAEERAALLAADPDNAVAVILPDPTEGTDGYQVAADRLQNWVDSGHLRVDDRPALYVYEMRDSAGAATRGLVGAVELRDPVDGVILPHENTMAGPVADRLALMTATEADVEPIYLVYDGGGAASNAVAGVEQEQPLAGTTTGTGTDAIEHTLWRIEDRATLRAIAEDLATRKALIADGHHRYATYRELQQRLRAERGAGPWDFGLTLLVDSTHYGPQVHAIHRVVRVGFDDAIAALDGWEVELTLFDDPDAALAALVDRDQTEGFAAVLSNGDQAVLVADTGRRLREASQHEGETATLDRSRCHRAAPRPGRAGLEAGGHRRHGRLRPFDGRCARRCSQRRRHRGPAAGHPGGCRGSSCRGRRPHAPQVDAVHAEARVRTAHASLLRRRLSRAVATCTS